VTCMSYHMDADTQDYHCFQAGLRSGNTSDSHREAYGLIPGRESAILNFRFCGGRAVAQAVSRWLSTAAARVRVRAACGVCGGQSSTGAGFLRVLRFPLPIIPPFSPSS
jgi:hypothetical protein